MGLKRLSLIPPKRKRIAINHMVSRDLFERLEHAVIATGRRRTDIVEYALEQLLDSWDKIEKE